MMDIKHLTQNQTQPRTAGEGRGVGENTLVRAGGATGGTAGGVGGDRVTLSEAATRLSDVVRTVSEQPVVDNARVEQIREAIREGRYEVNPERIGDRLIAMEKLR